MRINFGRSQFVNLLGCGFEHSLLALPGLKTEHLRMLKKNGKENLASVADLGTADLVEILFGKYNRMRLGKEAIESPSAHLFYYAETVIIQARAAEGSYGLSAPSYNVRSMVILRARMAKVRDDVIMETLTITREDLDKEIAENRLPRGRPRKVRRTP